MKKRLALALALMMLLSLAACGGTGTGASSAAQSSAASAGGSSITSQDYENAMSGLNLLTQKDDRLGKEYYQFPAVTKYAELPDPAVWTQMGMIDLTPKGCEKGSIYDDGTVILDGMWNGFSIECDCSWEAYEELIGRLWDAGYRGVPVGNGVIVEADKFEDVYDSFEKKYGAFYEHDGWTLFVEANYYEWSGQSLCGVVDAKTMTKDREELVEWPKIDWSVTAAGAPKNGLASVGSDFHGNWGDYEIKDYNGSYTTSRYLVYAQNVSASEFESYTEKLSKQDGIYVEADYFEDEWENWSIYYADDNKKAEGFWYVGLGYCEKANMVCWLWEK